MANRALAPTKRPRRSHKLDWLVPAVVAGSLMPYVWLAYRAWRGALGANPISTALNQLGLLALIFLLASLACTPLKLLFGFKWPIRIRKTLGLFGFWTALCHFFVYFALDQVLSVSTVLEDIAKRPFITVGAAALLLLTPLAITSTKQALQRLGAKRWRRLHKLAYLAAALGAIHYYMRVKQDTREPLVYAAVLAILLGVRLISWLRTQRANSGA